MGIRGPAYPRCRWASDSLPWSQTLRPWSRSDEGHDAAVLRGGQRLVEKPNHVLEFHARFDRLRRNPLVFQDLARGGAGADLGAVLDRVAEHLAEGRISGKLDLVGGPLPQQIEAGGRRVDAGLVAHRGGAHRELEGRVGSFGIVRQQDDMELLFAHSFYNIVIQDNI